MIDSLLYNRVSEVHSNTFALRAPEGVTFPCVITQRISTVPVRDLEGADGSADFVFQVDAYANGYTAAKALATTLRHQLDGWTATGVKSCAYLGESDMIDETTNTTLYRVMQEYRLFADLD